MTQRIYFLLIAYMLTVVFPANNDAKSAPDNTSQRNISQQSALSVGQAEFAKGNWDTAIPYLKKHLRSIPGDYAAWNLLAASYYHSGQVRQALETLQRIEKGSPDKAFNFFYQGMCIAVLGSEKDAIRYWEYAAYWPNEYGAKATFELGVSAYNSGDDAKAKQWFTIYLQKFPRGPEVASVKELLKSLEGEKKIEGTKAFERPDPESTIYKYHPWSLFKFPHFWQIQTGFKQFESSGFEPVGNEGGAAIKGGIRENLEVEELVNVSASIGVGPVRQKNATSFAGYTYKQNWILQENAGPEWIEEGFALEAFPLRGDMMERSHQFFGDIRRQFTPNIFVGAYARLEFSRIGSSFFPSPDESSLKIVTPETDTQLFIPWVGYSWSPTSRSLFQLYMRKEIHNQSPEHSNKTFDITGTSGEPAMSLGLTHAYDIPSKNIELNFDAFLYEFIFNDYWLDYSRTGGIFGIDYLIYKGIGASAILGMYRDKYKLPHIKTGSCDAVATGQGSSTPVSCPRSDSGNLIQVNVYWNKSPNLRFDLSYQMVENQSNLKVYSESRNVILANAVWAFPGTKRVSRMTGRFADAAFTKDTTK